MTGGVVRVGLTPLKGARHTSLEAVDLDRDGPVGDRLFCAVDTVGRQVLRTVQHPSLPAVRAHWDGVTLDLALPSGERVVAAPVASGEALACEYWGRQVELDLQEGPHAALLSAHLGRPVRLAAAPRRAVVYGGSVSVVTTASVRALSTARGGVDLDPARFRATAVVDTGEGPFAEDDWSGRALRLGPALVRVTGPIPRCAVLDLHPVTGGRDRGVLEALASLRPAGPPGALCFGVQAEVVVPGRVAPGDPVGLS